MTLSYIANLGLTTQKTSIGAQKIDDSLLKTYDMILACYLLQDSLARVRCFEKTFLLANTNMEVILGMPFLSLSNVNVEFAKLGKFTWRIYIGAETLPITSWVEFIDKKVFAKVVLDDNFETFVVYVATLEMPIAMPIHLLKTS